MKLRTFALIGALLASTATTGSLAQNEDMFETGQALFEALAPPEIKAEFEFPTRAQWDDFATRLEKTRETGSLAELAAYEPEARIALAALRIIPGYEDYADWLADRLDDIVVAKEAEAQRKTGLVIEVSPPPPAPPDVTPSPLNPPVGPIPTPPPRPPQPSPKPNPPPIPKPVQVTAGTGVPLYELWVERLKLRPRPARADEFLPVLKGAFNSQGVAEALVWLAESESTFNPRARSPAGARGLFQLMPVTAKAMGLSLLPFDERTQPDKSALAAAGLLRKLHGLFGSWPLALAAYNAGEGTVRRALKSNNSTTFAEIAEKLPSETRLYVPKVLATVALRTGLEPNALAAPRAR
jgi:membrane-bound lytic murein transglycosylase D